MLMVKDVEDLTSVNFLPAPRIEAQADSRIADPILISRPAALASRMTTKKNSAAEDAGTGTIQN